MNRTDDHKSIELTSVVLGNPELLSTEINGQLMMMDLDMGHYIHLDEIGHEIWKQLMQPRKVYELCQSLANRYSGSSKVIEHDVLALLQEMYDNNIIVLTR